LARGRGVSKLRISASYCSGEIADWRLCGEQVAINTLAPEGLGVKYEKRKKMSVQLQIEEMPGYLKARFIGAGATEEVERQFELLAKKCKSSKKNKLLLDFTEVPAEISLVDRYELGKRTLVFAQYKCKVAAVCRPELHDSQRFLETVAQNRWVELRVFKNVEDALEWLLK
jgi:hypothetical protein